MKTQSMKGQSSKTAFWSLVLVALGLLALYSGPQGLGLLVPAAILIWYAVAKPTADRHRN
jgi:4-amino-4-deoxy-L-arabinose transferase-like glycosyltransferase